MEQKPQLAVAHDQSSSQMEGSTTPHCLVCNVHLGVYARGGMEVFSEKVTSTFGKAQIHSVLGSIINQELNATYIHSTIVCKKCFKLIDDIDSLEGQLFNLKQVVNWKYMTTMALVKKGLVGKAVVVAEQSANTPGRNHTEHDRTTETTIFTAIPGQSLLSKVGQQHHFTVNNQKIIMQVGGEVTGDSENKMTLMTCNRCNREFTSSFLLSEHMETHRTDSKSLMCDICKIGFLSTDSLVRHKKLHKGNKIVRRKTTCQVFDITQIKQYQCQQCSRVFTTKYLVEEHERTHTLEKPFKCETCGKCFRQKGNLSSHVRVTHLQERRFKCQVCDRSFKFKRLLTGHTMSVHTGERPFKCEFCDAGFVYQQHFKKHMRIHTGEKPYNCEVCGKSFNSSYNCRSHMYIHSNLKPYECTLCGTGFMRKSLILSHISQHDHMEDPERYVKTNAL